MSLSNMEDGDENNEDTVTLKEIKFDNYEDVQTRLILLPMLEEECTGATVSSYTNWKPSWETDTGTNEQKEESEDEKKERGEEKEINNNNENIDIVGYNLCRISGHEDTKNWLEVDFTDILAAIREAEVPITLSFQPSPALQENKIDDKVPGTTSDDAIATAQNRADLLVGQLSRWGSRLRVTSQLLAAETAIRATNLAEKTIAASATSPRRESPILSPSQQNSLNKGTCLRIQTEDGAFTPLTSDHVITNCSILQVVSPNPIQWSVGNTPIPNATHASFQPSAVHIGKNIECVIDKCLTLTTGSCVVADTSLLAAAKNRLEESEHLSAVFLGLSDCNNELKYQLFMQEGQLSFHSESDSEPFLVPITKGDLTVGVDPCHTRLIVFKIPSLGKEWKLLAPNRIARESILLTLHVLVKEDDSFFSTLVDSAASLESNKNISASSSSDSPDSNIQDCNIPNEYLAQMKTIRKENTELTNSYQKSQHLVQCQEDTLKTLSQRLQDFSTKIQSLERVNAETTNLLAQKDKKIENLERENKVLQISLESKEEKLCVLDAHKKLIATLEKKVDDYTILEQEMDEKNKEYNTLLSKAQHKDEEISQLKKQVETHEKSIETLNAQLSSKQSQHHSFVDDFQALEQRNHKLLTERNSYKQKSDSLSKEMAKYHSKTQESVTKIEREYQNQITNLLSSHRALKKELSEYTILYEQSIEVQKQMALEKDNVHQIVRQKMDLERVVRDLTEYVNAKEMQLDTIKEVNKVLEDEVKRLSTEKGDV